MSVEQEPGTAGMSLDAGAFAAAAAIVSAVVMLLLGVFGALGIYEGAVEMMQRWHLYFTPTLGGTLAGMIEGAVVGYVVAYAFAWVYNRLARA